MRLWTRLTKTTNTYMGMACMVVGVLMLASADAVTKIRSLIFTLAKLFFIGEFLHFFRWCLDRMEWRHPIVEVSAPRVSGGGA